MSTTINTKVSIIIPVYNVEQYIERCIASVLNQTMQIGVEVIIINDCTPDRSMERISQMLRTYNDRPQEERMTIHIVNHETNRGIAAVRNTGISYAVGDYILQIDGDDWIETDMVERLYTKAVETDSDIVVCDFFNHTTHRIVRFQVKSDFENKKDYLGKLIEGYNVVIWNKLVKRTLYKTHNIQGKEGLDYGEDSVIGLQLYYYAKKVVHIPIPLYHHEIGNPRSICNNMTEKVKNNAIERVTFARAFLNKYNLMEYEKNWAFYAFHIKAILLYNFPQEEEFCRYLFPEADKYLTLYLKKTSLQNYLILTGQMKLCHVYIWLKKIVKNILKQN